MAALDLRTLDGHALDLVSSSDHAFDVVQSVPEEFIAQRNSDAGLFDDYKRRSPFLAQVPGNATQVGIVVLSAVNVEQMYPVID
nr:hypothetical protein [Silicimonas algicola]